MQSRHDIPPGKASLYDLFGLCQLDIVIPEQAVLCCRSYDRAAVKMRGNRAQLNFPDTDYSTDSFMKASHSSASLRTSRRAGITAANISSQATETKASIA